MTREVIVGANATADLLEIVDWIAENDSPARALHVLERIDSAIASLARFPLRGTYPRELLDLGIREFREIFFKPYRIIYQVTEERVSIVIILDGRRDVRALLAQRLLGA
jgi:toxin ParE1/3/4